jgi:hypothetical protein
MRESSHVVAETENSNRDRTGSHAFTQGRANLASQPDTRHPSESNL